LHVTIRPVNSPYQQLVREVDQVTIELSNLYQDHLQCRAGCSSCCHHHLSVFEVEAKAVSAAINALPLEVQTAVEEQAAAVLELEGQGSPVSCPLLIDDRCSIYENRPIICRTQGLPILLTDDDGVDEVDWCPLNFTSEAAEDDLDEAHLLRLDPLNLKLAVVNLNDSRESGLPDEVIGARKTMAEIILSRR
ncbi:MAG: YkgJ family cysteine cluster protein, partial [Acidobacteriota bacterium]